jgi:hypothetical protein
MDSFGSAMEWIVVTIFNERGRILFKEHYKEPHDLFVALAAGTMGTHKAKLELERILGLTAYNSKDQTNFVSMLKHDFCSTSDVMELFAKSISYEESCPGVSTIPNSSPCFDWEVQKTNSCLICNSVTTKVVHPLCFRANMLNVPDNAWWRAALTSSTGPGRVCKTCRKPPSTECEVLKAPAILFTLAPPDACVAKNDIMGHESLAGPQAMLTIGGEVCHLVACIYGNGTHFITLVRKRGEMKRGSFRLCDGMKNDAQFVRLPNMQHFPAEYDGGYWLFNCFYVNDLYCGKDGEGTG